MNIHCPDCGTQLNEIRDLRNLWLSPLKCPKCVNQFFLEVADSRWIYPLQRLELGVGEKIERAEDEILNTAAERIRRIDYKTVSIVDFEATLDGHFDQSRSYRIVYPDGSEK